MRHPHRDVVVIGHGVIGALACWRAARAGLTVGCLDPEPSRGASHAAAGMLAPVTEAGFGEEDLLRLNLESAACWPEFAAELEAETGVGVGYHRCGVLTIGYERSDAQELNRLTGLHRDHCLPAHQLSAERAREREPMLGARGIGGYWAPGDGQVDPRRLMAALEATGRSYGVGIHRSAARSLLIRQGQVIGVVDRAGDEHPADLVVLAAGHASGPLAAEAGLPVPTRAVKGQLIRLNGRAPGWPSTPRVVRGVVQQRPIYLVFRGADHDHHEVVVGASSEEWPDDRKITAGAIFALLRDARALLPGIDDLAVLETCSRARPGTPDNLPIFGRSALPGLVVGTGHYRNGILLSALTAYAFDQLFAGQPLDAVWKPADPNRFHDQTQREKRCSRV